MLSACVRAFVIVLGVATLASADVKLPTIIGSNMVLQRDMKVPIYGTAEPGEKVTVEFAGKSVSTEADADGKWEVHLPAMAANAENRTMSVKGNNTLTLENILVGEVWVCSGQSNMRWTVSRSNDADLEILTANYPKIRLVTLPTVASQTPLSEFEGEWQACSSETVPNFSAVGYFFGRRIHQALDVPVGLINNAWGGSAADAWVNRDVLAQQDFYKETMARWEQMENAENPNARLMNGNQRPANLYNGMLRPVMGFGIRGAIWYQGESNAGRAHQYRKLFPLMIQNWRDEWGQGDFPFYWVQLADFRPEVAEPGESDWAELREAQTMAMKLPNTGQAVIIDIGEANDIHPTDKQNVGNRLSRWALANDYGIDIDYRSPEFKSMEKEGNKITLTFDYVGPRMDTFDVGELKGFAVAGEDRKFHWAQAQMVKGAKDKIVVWSDAVSDPVAVRYGWANNPVVNVRSLNGLPLTPFRTDDWDGVTVGKY